MIRMRALKPFKFEGTVLNRSDDFTTSRNRARDYEARGLATPLGGPPAAIPAEAAPNAAAEAGPFVSPGGPTGAETAPSSSPAARPPRRRKSPSPKAAPAS
jgi:hypothetical protein